MYLSQQIIFHLFNHFTTMFSWRVSESAIFSQSSGLCSSVGLGVVGEEEGNPLVRGKVKLLFTCS